MNKTLKQYEVLRRASLFLEKHNRESGVAELLLQHYLDVSRATFYTMMREPVSDEVVRVFWNAIQKHAETGIPVQHLIGYETFYGREFYVNGDVLIPRPETEELVQHVIEMVRGCGRELTIVDIGTGSGIIASTLALELKNVAVYATDISEKALAVAKKNAARLGADVEFFQGDFLKPIIDRDIKADIIVSNPPYISHADWSDLQDTVKMFDPEMALFAAEDGLAAYQQIISDLPKAAGADCAVAFEIGFEQGAAVCSLVKRVYPESDVQILQDINGKDRIVTVRIRSS